MGPEKVKAKMTTRPYCQSERMQRSGRNRNKTSVTPDFGLVDKNGSAMGAFLLYVERRLVSLARPLLRWARAAITLSTRAKAPSTNPTHSCAFSCRSSRLASFSSSLVLARSSSTGIVPC